MNTNQAAIYLDMREAELRKHRAAGTGPKFTCDLSGRYNYAEADLDAFKASRPVQVDRTKFRDIVWAVPVVRASDAHLYPAWWPKMAAPDWLRTVQEARTATFVEGLGLLADSSLARTGAAGWHDIGIGAVHWCFDLRGDAPAWVKANVEAIRSMRDA